MFHIIPREYCGVQGHVFQARMLTVPQTSWQEREEKALKLCSLTARQNFFLQSKRSTKNRPQKLATCCHTSLRNRTSLSLIVNSWMVEAPSILCRDNGGQFQNVPICYKWPNLRPLTYSKSVWICEKNKIKMLPTPALEEMSGEHVHQIL